MVAIIKTGNSIHRTFHYNESKVKEGVAECIGAVNYPLDKERLTEGQRLNMLLKTAELNPDVKRNSVHISLNFAPGEQLSDEKLNEIAAEYMDRIGFGDQPFLVYKHNDAGHPHIHIATVKIRSDGTKIDMQNIGRNQSESARIALEKKYGLIRAEDHKRQLFSLKPVDAQKALYGTSETKRAIGNVLEAVLEKYKYASLPELNAVLSLYNVKAERGSEESRTFKTKGLVYRVLDADGKPIGVPIKASLFHNRPTLEFIERRFLTNELQRQEHKDKLKSTIDFLIKANAPRSLEDLSELLMQQGVRVVYRTNEHGVLFGLTFVDMRSRCVFNGSLLGKAYSAKALLERFGKYQKNEQTIGTMMRPGTTSGDPGIKVSIPHEENKIKEKTLFDQLMQVENVNTQLPYELTGRKKKKRKKRKN